MVLLLSQTNSLLKADINEQHYNYYFRDKDGTFILESIDDSVLSVRLFSYKAESENSCIKKIAGYYYGTDIKNFVLSTMKAFILTKTERFVLLTLDLISLYFQKIFMRGKLLISSGGSVKTFCKAKLL